MSSSRASSVRDAYAGRRSSTSKMSPRGPSTSRPHRSRKPSLDSTRKPRQTDGFSRDHLRGIGLSGRRPGPAAAERRTSSTEWSAGCVLCGSRNSRQSPCVATKKCADEALFPLARPWNSGRPKQLSTPARYSGALKASRPSRRHTSSTTFRAPPSKSSSTVCRKMGPSSNTAQARPRRKAGARRAAPSSPACAVAASKRCPAALAEDVGPNHAEGSLPNILWPVPTRLFRENGAEGVSKKHEAISK
mmetsp:Transcript_117269/g.318350  ORF Transcript_117269/g.318350 Transcript_117269/m.318350 type:complete len:247 (+) Transcript_117269:45-785(+)